MRVREDTMARDDEENDHIKADRYAQDPHFYRGSERQDPTEPYIAVLPVDRYVRIDVGLRFRADTEDSHFAANPWRRGYHADFGHAEPAFTAGYDGVDMTPAAVRARQAERAKAVREREKERQRAQEEAIAESRRQWAARQVAAKRKAEKAAASREAKRNVEFRERHPTVAAAQVRERRRLRMVKTQAYLERKALKEAQRRAYHDWIQHIHVSEYKCPDCGGWSTWECQRPCPSTPVRLVDPTTEELIVLSVMVNGGEHVLTKEEWLEAFMSLQAKECLDGKEVTQLGWILGFGVKLYDRPEGRGEKSDQWRKGKP